MVQAQMTKRKRDKAIRDALVLNEQVRELGDAVATFRENASDDQKEIAESLAYVADELNYEVREQLLDLVSKNLGPQQQSNLMLVLKKAGQWVDEERRQLQGQPKQFSGLRTAPSRNNARRLRDLNYFETFLRKLARDILRIMADYNFQKNRAR